MTKARSLSVALLLVFAMLTLVLSGCPSRKSHSGGQKDGGGKNPVVRSAPLKVRKHWDKNHWVAGVRKDPNALLSLFKTLPDQDADAYKDLLALLKGRVKRALMRSDKVTAKKSDMARHLRARLHLRRARYFRQGYDFSMMLSTQVYGQRSALAKQLKLGLLFRYYFGRLLCLRGQAKKAAVQLDKALAEAPKKVHGRIQLWKTLCQETDKAKVAAALKNLDFSKDPRGWAEAQFLAWRAGIQLKKELPSPTPRAQLFAAVRKGKPFQARAAALRKPAEIEEIQESGFKGELKFFDPAPMLVLSHYHAGRALSWLKGLKKASGLSPILKAEAHLLRNEKTQAIALLKAYVSKPPASLQTATLLFSRHLSKTDVLDFARFLLAGVLTGKERETQVKALSKHGLPSTVFASLLNRKPGKAEMEVFDKAAMWIADSVKGYKKSLSKAAEKKETGAMLVLQNSLHTFLLRSVTQWASMGVLRHKKSYLAVRWMETLHHKAAPYKIGGRNQADQIVQTAMAYTLAGQMGVATEFCLKNRQSYPALNQHWALLGTLRILRGMGGGTVKGI